MNCSYQLSREHKGLREELGIANVTLGPEFAMRTEEHSVGGKPTRQVERCLGCR
ncbi:hypothetical protein [Streptomyces hirsutus]|uniref:hypothetical protein n=1 Tax=Streptomyces hirsutus TaxID=35620 RepID=UPI003695EF9B